MGCLKFLEWSKLKILPCSKTSFEKISKMSSSSLHNLPSYEELYPDDGNPPTYSGFQIHKPFSSLYKSLKSQLTFVQLWLLCFSLISRSSTFDKPRYSTTKQNDVRLSMIHILMCKSQSHFRIRYQKKIHWKI